MIQDLYTFSSQPAIPQKQKKEKLPGDKQDTFGETIFKDADACKQADLTAPLPISEILCHWPKKIDESMLIALENTFSHFICKKIS